MVEWTYDFMEENKAKERLMFIELEPFYIYPGGLYE